MSVIIPYQALQALMLTKLCTPVTSDQSLRTVELRARSGLLTDQIDDKRREWQGTGSVTLARSEA